MKIALIDGSPKKTNSTSKYILDELHNALKDELIYECPCKKSVLETETMTELATCEVWVISFPLYVDGIPAHLLSCLLQLEKHLASDCSNNIMVYAFANCGFYEGAQNEIAINMIENWCEKSGLSFGGGIGIGAGPLLLGTKDIPAGKGTKKNYVQAMTSLFHGIKNKKTIENKFINPNFPKLGYKLLGEIGWKKHAKANGLKTQDLFSNDLELI